MGAAPLDFSDRAGLRRSIEGASVLYNTYWVRFGRGPTNLQQAVENSRILFEAAAGAGVERIVHFSVASASKNSGPPYFRGKGQADAEVREVYLKAYANATGARREVGAYFRF